MGENEVMMQRMVFLVLDDDVFSNFRAILLIHSLVSVGTAMFRNADILWGKAFTVSFRTVNTIPQNTWNWEVSRSRSWWEHNSFF